MSEDREDIRVDSESGRAGYDTHDANLKPIIAIGVVSIVLLVVILIFIDLIFISTKEKLVEEMVLSPQSLALRELRAKEDEALNSYRVLDAEKGVYRIPIERAVELIAAEAYRNQQMNIGEQ
jgi:hypothetical protein